LQLLLVAEVGAEPVGLVFGCIDPAEPEIAHVYQMWVAPHARGRGCGTVLLRTVLAWVRGTGARSVTLGVTCGNSSARRLYERAGFKPLPDLEPLRPGSTELVQPMILTL
jgi:GNAT superfamily N-acetyltransferase